MAPLISSPATVSYGAQLNFETLTDEASLRFQPLQDTLLRVIDGVAELRFDGEEHLLGPGGEAIVPAGFHHTLCAVSGQARIVMGFRAARCFPPPPLGGGGGGPPPPRSYSVIASTRAYQPSRSRSTGQPSPWRTRR